MLRLQRRRETWHKLDVGTKPPSIIMTGQYTDVLVRTAGGWRFKSREVKNDAAPAKS